MSLSLFTGKGGVGKTRTSRLYSQSIRAKMNLDPSMETLTSELLVRVLKIPGIADWLSKRKLLQNLLRLAPNLEELLILHSWVRTGQKEEIVVDAPSTGTFLGVLQAVPTALKMFDGGAIRELAVEVDEFLKRPNQTRVFLITLPENSAIEEMNILESEIKNLYPSIQILRVLNRKHSLPPLELNLNPALQNFCNHRYEIESNRIKPIRFDHEILEGAGSW